MENGEENRENKKKQDQESLNDVKREKKTEKWASRKEINVKWERERKENYRIREKLGEIIKTSNWLNLILQPFIIDQNIWVYSQILLIVMFVISFWEKKGNIENKYNCSNLHRITEKKLIKWILYCITQKNLSTKIKINKSEIFTRLFQ